jgi:hypothetical protein
VTQVVTVAATPLPLEATVLSGEEDIGWRTGGLTGRTGGG